MRNLYQEFRVYAEDFGAESKDELFEALVWFVYEKGATVVEEGEMHQITVMISKIKAGQPL